MDELKLYVSRILQLQKKYSWMMDSYVLMFSSLSNSRITLDYSSCLPQLCWKPFQCMLCRWLERELTMDFFTEKLWDKLCKTWSPVLADLKPEEIAYFFFVMYSPFKPTEKSYIKQKFREVWPLELLAFIASCEALKLHHQQWVAQYNKRKCQNRNKCTLTSTRCGHDPEDLEQADAQVKKTNENTNIGQFQNENHSLSHPFRSHMKQKKQYEIDVVSKVICDLAEKLQCWNIVDVGAGLGHLSRLLSYGCKLRVVTIEGEGCHQNRAEKIDKKIVEYLEKKNGGSVENKSLVHVTQQINASISATEFSTVVRQAFSKMENNSLQHTTYCTQEKSNFSDHFLIVGLHTCGDLASTLLRIFTQCHNAVGIVSVGCCYMKLSHEEARTDQGITMPNKRTEQTACAHSPQNNLTVSSTSQNTSKETQCGSVHPVQTPKLTNSHTLDSSLKSSCFDRKNHLEFDSACSRETSSDLFSNFEINKVCEKSFNALDALMVECKEATAAVENILGYPMSAYVKSLSAHRQTYNALESACHAIERYHKKLSDNSPTLKLHYYRALLERLLKKKDSGCSRRQIRTLKTKKAANMTFLEYVTNACGILHIRDVPTLQEIQTAEAEHAGKQFRVVVFYVLRLLMAPLVEGLLLADKLIYIREQYPDMKASISIIFDPNISPRNLSIIAEK